MSELFFDTIDESEIPAGMARVRYEAGAVEPLYANDEFFSLLGYQRRSPDDFYPLDVRNSHGWRAFCGQLRAHIEAGETDFEIEVNQETATGTLLWTMARCRHDARRGTVTCLVLDVSSWMDTSERLRMSEDAFRIAAQMSGKNIATFDLADRALTMQGAVEGYLTAPARMVNVPDSAIAAGMIAPEHVELYRSLYRDMETGVPRGGVMLRMRDFDTRRFRWYQVDYSLVFDGENRPVYAVVAFGDTTERHERELVQKARAERDALTGVLNRATFEDGCTRIIERSEVDHGHALIMADLDRFKTTNDRYGHVAGDRVIVESVAGVVSAVRDDDLVGRVGGDEFMVCLRGISSRLMVEAVAHRMCAAVREAAEASDDDHGPVSISLGIALYPQDGVTYEELYRKADKALYCAKRAGGGTYAFYRDEPAASERPALLPARLPHAALLDGVEQPLPVEHAHLAVDIAHMVLRRALRDGQLVADVAHRAPAGQQHEHLGLAVRQAAHPRDGGALLLEAGVGGFLARGGVELLHVGLREEQHAHQHERQHAHEEHLGAQRLRPQRRVQ